MISFMKASRAGSYFVEVNTFADLPTASNVPNANYLVLQETGSWITFNLKRAGIYHSDGSTWARMGNAQNFFYDSEFAIRNTDDTSKLLRISASGISPSSTRTLTAKDTDGTIFVENVSTVGEVKMKNLIGNPTHIDTFNEVYNHMHSAGVMQGCDFTDNGDGTVSFSSGYATLRDIADSHADLYQVELSAQANLTLIDNSTNYIYLDYNGGSPEFKTTESASDFNCLDKCVAYLAVRVGTDITYIDLREQNVDISTKARRLFLDFARFIPVQGGSSVSEAGLLGIALTAGAYYFMVKRQDHPAFDTSVAGTATENVFKLHYRDGAGGWTEVANSKTIDTTTYDGNTGTPVTLGNNKYGVTWFYICNNTPSTLCAVMGQEEYSKQSDAEVASPPVDLPPRVEGLGVLVGFVVYEKSASTFNNVLSASTISFSSSTAVEHNGLSGLQGGDIAEYYHITSAQHGNLTTNAWNLGTYNTDGTDLSFDIANYVTVTINGTPVKLAVLS